MRIDHVIVAARDMTATADRLMTDHGLASVDGGEHPAWGTANRIVPAGAAYLEVMGIRDLETARTTAIGQWVIGLTTEGDQLAAVCLAVDDVDATATRLGLTVTSGERTTADGATISWRMAGVEAAISHGMPFFITWTDITGSQVELPAGVDPARGINDVEVGGDPHTLEQWLGADVPGLTLAGGAAGVRSVTISTRTGTVRLGGQR